MTKTIELNIHKLLGFKLIKNSNKGAKIGKLGKIKNTPLGSKIGKAPDIIMGAKIGKVA